MDNAFPARIVARDFSREVALLKVESPQLLPVAAYANKSDVLVGQWTVALGKTYDRQQVSQSVGIVSAVDRAYGKAIQTDAKVSPINYGGPLIDVTGRIIGILSPISPGVFLEGDSSQLYDSGIGFAIPIEDIIARLPAMKLGQDIHSGKLGVVSADQNELIGPVRITGTAPGSPAAKAKLQSGDVIVSAGGGPIKLLAHLKHALGPVDAGSILPLIVERDGTQLHFEPTLVAEIPIYRRRYLGLRVTETPAGLRIDDIDSNSPAAKTTLQIGQLITHCNGERLTGLVPIQNAIAVAELDQPLVVHVLPTPGANAPEEATQVEIPQDPSAAAKTVEILASTWPETIATTLPEVEPVADPQPECDIVDVALGDFPNKAYAIVPPDSQPRSLGLLVVFPEPGELPREATQAYWSSFCSQFGWIVAVINSGDPSGWSREEIELAGRVIGRLSNSYAIDKQRTVIAGLGVGGRIALAASLSEGQRVSGAMTISTDLSRFRWPRSNAPMQSTDFLLVGPTKTLTPVAQTLSDKGYVANVVEAGDLDLSQWDSFPTAIIRRWLEGLGRL
jgi:S1-C subfamily serine protease